MQSLSKCPVHSGGKRLVSNYPSDRLRAFPDLSSSLAFLFLPPINVCDFKDCAGNESESKMFN